MAGKTRESKPLRFLLSPLFRLWLLKHARVLVAGTLDRTVRCHLLSVGSQTARRHCNNLENVSQSIAVATSFSYSTNFGRLDLRTLENDVCPQKRVDFVTSFMPMFSYGQKFLVSNMSQMMRFAFVETQANVGYTSHGAFCAKSSFQRSVKVNNFLCFQRHFSALGRTVKLTAASANRSMNSKLKKPTLFFCYCSPVVTVLVCVCVCVSHFLLTMYTHYFLNSIFRLPGYRICQFLTVK